MLNNVVDKYEEVNELISLYYSFNISCDLFKNNKIVKPSYIASLTCQRFLNEAIDDSNSKENNDDNKIKKHFLTLIGQEISKQMSYEFSIDLFSKIVFFGIMTLDDLKNLIKDSDSSSKQPVINIPNLIINMKTFYNPFFVIQQIVKDIENKEGTAWSIKESIALIYSKKIFNSKSITKKILNIIDIFILNICDIIVKDNGL